MFPLSLILSLGGYVTKAFKWFSGTMIGRITLAILGALLTLLIVFSKGKTAGREQEQVKGLERDNDALRRMQEADAGAPSTRPGVSKRLRDGTF